MHGWSVNKNCYRPERVAYYSQVLDYGIIDISQGPYNYARSLSYSGDTVLGKPGSYKVEVDVLDQISVLSSLRLR